MHGRKKSDQKSKSEAEKEALKAKVANYQQLAQLALSRRKTEGDPNSQLLLTAQLLRVNPDVYTFWNQRKEFILQSVAVDANKAEGPETDIEATFGEELVLAADCIKKNPKSYGAWYHRLWCFEQMRAIVDKEPKQHEKLVSLLETELVLCGRFLDADERNFHCWNYRRYVVSIHPDRTAKMEFDYSTERIVKNFSNYSAFHHRSTYIQDMLSCTAAEGRGEEEWGLLEAELEMVKQAMYTEPDDQTAWWYHQYLINWAAGLGTQRFEATLRGEIESVRGILEETEEGEYRWSVMALASLLRQLAAVVSDEQEKKALLAESRQVCETLVRIDPDHRQRYLAMIRALER